MADEVRSFNADRYPPVRVAALLRLPESNARSFAIAAALGRFVRANGRFDPVRSGKDVGAIVVGRTQRAKIMDALNIKERRWRALVTDWEARYLAHRCKSDTVCLFVRPLEEACPACGTEIVFDHVSTRPDARRSGTSTTAQPALVVPLSGSNSAGGGVPTVPHSVARTAHPEDVFLQGHEVGVPQSASPDEEEQLTNDEKDALALVKETFGAPRRGQADEPRS